MDGYRFDLDTAVEPAGSSFRGELHERWTIAGVPNGGYALTLALRASQAVSSHQDPLSCTAYFLAPTTVGPAEVEATVVKPGRTTTAVAASLTQEGRERIRAMVLLGDLAGRAGPSHDFLHPPTWDEPWEQRAIVVPMSFPTNFDIRIPVSLAGGVVGEPSGTPHMGGTIAFADGRPPDLLSMPVMADGFPPVAFNLGHVAWTPTLELTVHFWNRPVPGPVTVAIRTGTVQHGYMDESADLWDAGGTLVARSRQLARIL